jgi:hypothetical protein
MSKVNLLHLEDLEDYESFNITEKIKSNKRSKNKLNINRLDNFYAKVVITTGKESIDKILESINTLGDKSPFFGVFYKNGTLLYESKYKDEFQGDLNALKLAFKHNGINASFNIKTR